MKSAFEFLRILRTLSTFRTKKFLELLALLAFLGRVWEPGLIELIIEMIIGIIGWIIDMAYYMTIH